jgi:hypothetical protein
MDDYAEFRHLKYLLAILGKDAKSSSTKTGKQVTRFSIAANKKWTDKAGKEHETTDWFRDGLGQSDEVRQLAQAGRPGFGQRGA